MVMGVAGNAVLLGPTGPGFWTMFQKTPEWQDGGKNPVDRWSERVIREMAGTLGAAPLFPFGPKAGNFLQLPLDSGQAWQSPVGMLVHDQAGLMVSYRGALVFDTPVHPRPQGGSGANRSNDPAKPCTTCAAPCTTACPVGALTSDGYDVPTCHAFMKTKEGQDCLNHGCRVRRACPVSQTYGRDPEQSGYHMSVFLK